MKTKKELSIEKRQKTKADNEKKILEILGYEIWRDPLNYTVVKNGKNLYFSTFQNALKEVRNELIRNRLSGSESINIAIKRIERVDEEFLNALSTRIASLGEEFN